MVKKKRKSPRKAREKVDEECVALIRAYFKRKGFALREQVANGAHVFADVFETIESIVTIVRMFVAVERKEVSAVCEIPLQVPASCAPEVLKFINHMNSMDMECGMIVLDPEDNLVTIHNGSPVSVLKGGAGKAIEDLFDSMIVQAGVFGDSILKIITDGSLEGQQGEKQSAKETDTNAKGEGQGKRASKGPKAPTAITPDYSLDGLDIRSEVPLEQIVAAVARFSKTRRSSEVAPRLSILLSGPSGC